MINKIMRRNSLTILFLFILGKFEVDSNGCIPRKFSYDSVVCVCNATYCDTLSDVTAPSVGKYVMYTSSRDGLRFHRSMGSFKTGASSVGVHYEYNSWRTFQEIHGFGGAFTDSAGINILSLSKPAQNLLLQSYFSKDGLEYSLGRLPIGGTDFSTRIYSYHDNIIDPDLKSFNLTKEDFNYKIPIIQRAQSFAQKTLKLIASCWSPPVWMKTNNKINGMGFLKREYYEACANYHVKFLEAYKQNEIDVWCITTGNEPMNAFYGSQMQGKINSMGWIPKTQREWIGQYLGPAIRSSPFNVCILTGDDQRHTLPWWLKEVMEDKEAAKYVNGTAVHWYTDRAVPPVFLEWTQKDFPKLFIINTEACIGIYTSNQLAISNTLEGVTFTHQIAEAVIKSNGDPKVQLGAWSAAQYYAHDIIQDLNNWVGGWMDWNLALNEKGGPNWVENYVDSPVIVSKEKDEFYKQPMFYALGHFSKFFTPGSVRIEHTISPADRLETVSVIRPDLSIAVVVLNRNSNDVQMSLKNGEDLAVINIPKYSVNSILFKKNAKT